MSLIFEDSELQPSATPDADRDHAVSWPVWLLYAVAIVGVIVLSSIAPMGVAYHP